MLVTRQCETVRHTWSSSKLRSPDKNQTASRMSNLEPLTTQPDWRDSYSQYLPSAENVLSSPYEQSISSHPVDAPITHQLFAPRPSLSHRHSLAQVQVENRHETFLNPPIERSDSAPPINGLRQEAFRASEPKNLSHVDPSSKSSPPLGVKGESSGLQHENVAQTETKEEEEEDDDDDEILDSEERGGTEGRPPQTEAERRAERRKMKRFRYVDDSNSRPGGQLLICIARLTHQQTRFLMSEFAKQAHPDAAHRERLSREIPGLSPRQVQVWFQNR